MARGPRTVPLTDPQGRRLRWPIDIWDIHVYSRDAESVIFVPSSRFWVENQADDLDALWREDTEALDCFKTSYAYNMIDQDHPRIVPVIGQDAWTGLPILKKPSYSSLWTFIQNYGSQNFPGSFFSGIEFSPEYLPLSRSVRVPTLKTDMFMFGRLVDQIMTSELPGDGMGRDWGETERLMTEEDWMPDLEDVFMRRILHKCWKFDCEDIEELQSDVHAFVEGQGWNIRGDELEGFDVDSIHRQLEANFVPEDKE
ncbi:uncharacterized protein FMAN_09643 [Fusarium mangiferae]|uniref:Protein kinase domain-containing protein n=1 Tax=Fusarium mangiferae TaxID=192010 RepID=A0A1L7UJ34_FUSMA|nr:uncharacterized protein FMAN_09643 [Fusarium mangiferae]CVL08045.1 uncharacterized protein FMAN_09643 [Fusarium mangiferae]